MATFIELLRIQPVDLIMLFVRFMRSLNKGNLKKSRQIYCRYLVIGLVNTMITMGVFMSTSSRFDYVTSYLAAYSVGILINLYFQPKIVFQVKSSAFKRKRLLFANLLTIGVGVSLSYLLEAKSVEPLFAATITTLITISFKYHRFIGL